MNDQTTETRLRLAHKARRAKEHQLDDIRRALCDIGFMEDDDPYSHADLADVIRQNGQALLEQKTVPRALFDENARRHQAAVDRVDELLAAIERVRKVATAIRDATAAGRNDWQIGQHDCALTILAALTEPAPAATGATGHRYLSTGCLHGEHGYCSNVDGT